MNTLEAPPLHKSGGALLWGCLMTSPSPSCRKGIILPDLYTIFGSEVELVGGLDVKRPVSIGGVLLFFPCEVMMFDIANVFALAICRNHFIDVNAEFHNQTVAHNIATGIATMNRMTICFVHIIIIGNKMA